MSCFSRPNFSSIATLPLRPSCPRTPPSSPITFSVQHPNLRSLCVSNACSIQFLPQPFDFCDNAERFVHPPLPLGRFSLGAQVVDPAFPEIAFEFSEAGASLFQSLKFVNCLIGSHNLMQ